MKRAPVENLRFVESVMHITLDYEMFDEILWTRKEREGYYKGLFEAAVMCNDVFYWGVADAEDLTKETLPLLEKAYADCKAIKGPEIVPGKYISNQYFGGTLYCARQRNMRPQGAYYTHIPRRLWDLFNECGPEREVGAGNPYEPGEYDQSKMVKIEKE